MKIRQRLTVLAAAALIILGGLGLSGCSKSTKADNKTQTITVGTSGAPKPFTYVNSHQKLVGYDIDTVRAIAKEIPGLKVNFQKTEIPSILAGLIRDASRWGPITSRPIRNGAKSITIQSRRLRTSM